MANRAASHSQDAGCKPGQTRGARWHSVSKMTVRTADGWPTMQPLGKKEADLLKRNMAPGERVLGQVIGSSGQAVVATDHKVLVVKTGLMAGQTFGGKATSFDYRTIVGVEVRTGWSVGEFEIIAAALSAPQRNRVKDKVNIKEGPNGVVFVKANVRHFEALAAKIREMTGAMHGAGTAVRPQAAAPPEASIPDQIRSLSELHAAGILTDDEFAAKKAELLARM
jgi:hypothetical protein